MKPTSLFLSLLVAAAPVAAQEPAHAHGQAQAAKPDHMAMMHEMMAPMMRLMAFNPEHLLARREALALTPQQVTRLTALRDGAKATHDAAQTESKTHRDALIRTMASATPDTTAVRQHFRAAHDAMGKAHWAMLRASAQAKAVLNDGQRGRVEGWADAREMP